MNCSQGASETLTLFGKRLEEVVQECLRHAGIPFHHVEYHPTSDGKTALEVVSFFTLDLQPIEGLLFQLFDIDRDRTVTIDDRKRHGEQLPGTYLVYLDPIRKKLPEWEAFAHEPVLILLSSLFQGALFSLMGFFSDEALPDDPEIDSEINRFSAMVTELDEGFAALYQKQCPSQTRATSRDPAEEEEPPSVFQTKGTTPTGQVPTAVPGKPLDVASLRLFLTVGTPLATMCADVAEEAGLLIVSEDEWEHGEENLGHLFEFLHERQIVDYAAMESFFELQLGSWNKIYEALELARLQNLLRRPEMGLYELVLTLLKARTQPLSGTA